MTPSRTIQEAGFLEVANALTKMAILGRPPREAREALEPAKLHVFHGCHAPPTPRRRSAFCPWTVTGPQSKTHRPMSGTVNLSSRPDPLELPALPPRLPAPQWFGVQRIGSKALVRIDGEIGLTGATAGELLEAVAGTAEVHISIDSVGGDSAAALEIFDGLAGRTVTVEIIGRCFSAAVTIALAGSRITMRRDATMMIHAARLFAFGTEDELACASRRVARVNMRLRQIIAQRTEQPLATVDAWLARDSYFDAEQALSAGLVDAIVEPPPAPVADARRAETSEPSPTEDEALALSMLAALARLK